MDRWRVPITLATAFVSLTLVVLGCRSPVHNFAELDDPAPFVRARAAGLDGSVSDSRAIPALIAHLEDDDPVVRLSSHEALRERTGQDFGYIPYGTPEERSEAASRWRDWWEGQAGAPSGRWNRPRAGAVPRG